MTVFGIDEELFETEGMRRLQKEYPDIYSGCVSLWFMAACWSSRKRNHGVLTSNSILAVCNKYGHTEEQVRALLDVGLLTSEDGDFYNIENVFLTSRKSNELAR